MRKGGVKKGNGKGKESLSITGELGGFNGEMDSRGGEGRAEKLKDTAAMVQPLQIYEQFLRKSKRRVWGERERGKRGV